MSIISFRLPVYMFLDDLKVWRIWICMRWLDIDTSNRSPDSHSDSQSFRWLTFPYHFPASAHNICTLNLLRFPDNWFSYRQDRWSHHNILPAFCCCTWLANDWVALFPISQWKIGGTKANGPSLASCVMANWLFTYIDHWVKQARRQTLLCINYSRRSSHTRKNSIVRWWLKLWLWCEEWQHDCCYSRIGARGRHYCAILWTTLTMVDDWLLN